MSVVDHIIIAVEDLEKASQDYALMLGRAPSWRGTHPDYGSANTLFRLDNCYLELLAANGEGWAGDMVRGVFWRRKVSLYARSFSLPMIAKLFGERTRPMDWTQPIRCPVTALTTIQASPAHGRPCIGIWRRRAVFFLSASGMMICRPCQWRR